MNKKQTKIDMIKGHFLQGNSLTSNECLLMFGASRLADVVFKLKKPQYGGHTFKTEMVTVKDQFGNECTVAQYTMIREAKQGELFPVEEPEPIDHRFPWDESHWKEPLNNLTIKPKS